MGLTKYIRIQTVVLKENEMAWCLLVVTWFKTFGFAVLGADILSPGGRDTFTPGGSTRERHPVFLHQQLLIGGRLAVNNLRCAASE